IEPLLKQFNALFDEKDRYNTVKKEVMALVEINQRLGSALTVYHDQFIQPSLSSVKPVLEEKEKNWSLNLLTFNYTALSAEDVSTIAEAVPTIVKNFAQLEADFAKAKQDSYKEQKANYASLAEQIDHLNTRKDELPAGFYKALFSEKTNGHACLVAIQF